MVASVEEGSSILRGRKGRIVRCLLLEVVEVNLAPRC